MKEEFDAVIRFRAPKSLKDRLTAIAARRNQDLSEYLRQRCIDIADEHDPKGAARANTPDLIEALRAEHEKTKMPDNPPTS